MVRFILHSFIFKVTAVLSLLYITLIWSSNRVADNLWHGASCIRLSNLNAVYNPPDEYDNLSRVNIQLIERSKIALEGNKKFKFLNSGKSFSYFDTISLQFPGENEPNKINKVYLSFENSKSTDSIYFLISKFEQTGIYWNQILYSSVIISGLNQFTKDTADFRVAYHKLVNDTLLENNDTLISQVLYYLNLNEPAMANYDCTRNSMAFKNICDMFQLPCRLVGLQGGNSDQTGFDDRVGYPLHEICEVYSTKQKKWYVIDPTFGIRIQLRSSPLYLNAVEINNQFQFTGEREMVQDSIAYTKRTTQGRDYFRLYDNLFYQTGYKYKIFFNKFLKTFFKRYNYDFFQYSTNVSLFNSSYFYLIIKLAVYFFITILFVNLLLFFSLRRLFQSRKPPPVKTD